MQMGFQLFLVWVVYPPREESESLQSHLWCMTWLIFYMLGTDLVVPKSVSAISSLVCDCVDFDSVGH